MDIMETSSSLQKHLSLPKKKLQHSAYKNLRFFFSDKWPLEV